MDIITLGYAKKVDEKYEEELNLVSESLGFSSVAELQDLYSVPSMVLSFDEDGTLLSRFINKDLANAPILFKDGVTQISVEYLGTAKYLTLGGGNNLYTAISIADDQYFGRVVDFYGTGFNIITARAIPGEVVGAHANDFIKVTYANESYRFEIKRKDTPDYIDWFTLSVASLPSARGWLISTRLGFARFGETNSDVTVNQKMYRNISFYRKYGKNFEPDILRIEEEIAELKNEISYTPKFEKWAVLGDSITKANGIQDPYYNRVARALGIKTVLNYAVSGTRIAKNSDDDDSAMSVRYAEMDDTADLITVFGGTNDFGHGTAPLGELGDTDPSTFYGACYHLMDGLIKKYPTATIGFIAPLQRNLNGDEAKEIRGYKLIQFVDAIKETAEIFSIPVLDLNRAGSLYPDVDLVRESLMPDGLHPNDLGHGKLAQKIKPFLQRI
ncbi:SGNH/GDSL hydrolase family protein [Shouchella rhizosphaerae]|uniref:SGNH/GDSL hydrolase family protein n=1 Tax=Shouchella rhizosphaerae TaxID=866786 RepID=A0ABZ2CV04_9BACI